jgi:hypothetical protein
MQAGDDINGQVSPWELALTPLSPESTPKAPWKNEEGLSAKPGEFDRIGCAKTRGDNRQKPTSRTDSKDRGKHCATAIVVPVDERSIFIKGEVGKVEADFQRTYEADASLAVPAMALVDGMYGRIEARVHVLETEGDRPLREAQGKTELNS